MFKFALCVFVLFAFAALGQDTNSQATGSTQAAPVLQATVGEPPVSSSLPAIPEGTEPLIGGGDLLKVTVFGVKDFDEEVRVSARGDITLPLVGSVHVAGLTPENAGALVQKKLIDGHYMLHPQVSIFEKEYATQGVSV